MYPLMSVRPELRKDELQDRQQSSWDEYRLAFCEHSTNVLSVSYRVHIRFVHYTSVTLTLVDRSLSVTCSVRMRSLQLSRRLPSPDKHFLQFFCLFSVYVPLYVDM